MSRDTKGHHALLCEAGVCLQTGTQIDLLTAVVIKLAATSNLEPSTLNSQTPGTPETSQLVKPLNPKPLNP